MLNKTKNKYIFRKLLHLLPIEKQGHKVSRMRLLAAN